jgi:hypothetical protein
MNERSIELIFQSLGAASMCWTGAPSGNFDSSRCKEIGNELIAALDVESQKPSHNSAMVPCPKWNRWHCDCNVFDQIRICNQPCLLAQHQ